MSIQVYHQASVQLYGASSGLQFFHEGKSHNFENMNKVRAFFRDKGFDTLKLFHDGIKQYVHLDGKETFFSKKALRRVLSQESGGAWIEEKEGKKRYFIDESGWFQTSYNQVSKEEFSKNHNTPSTWQKALGISLGILAIAPGALELAKHFPFGAKEAGIGLLALQHKSPLLGAIGYPCLPSTVDAQAMGTEFQINNYTINAQRYPSVAPLIDGGFVVTWQSNGQDGDSNGIFGQRYHSTGDLNGVEFQVNTNTTSIQQYSSVAPLIDGGFVVTWQSNGQDGDGYGIFGQRYLSTGAPNGVEFQVNTNTTSDQQRPSVAPLNNGGFVVTWQSDGQDGDRDGIYGQRYLATGVPDGVEFQVNNYTIGSQVYPSVAPLNEGEFVVTWQSNGQDGGGDGIYARKYLSTGAPNGVEFQVNTNTTSDQQRPSVASFNDTGFVIAWDSNGQDGDGDGIYGQKYLATGAPNGPEFQVNTYITSHQGFPSIAPLKDRGFVISWDSYGQDGSAWEVYGQRYRATGAPNGAEFRVNTYLASGQQNPSVAPLNDGGFVIVWTSSSQDGSSYAVLGQRYDSNGTAIPLSGSPLMSVVSSSASFSRASSPSTSPNSTYPIISNSSPVTSISTDRTPTQSLSKSATSNIISSSLSFPSTSSTNSTSNFSPISLGSTAHNSSNLSRIATTQPESSHETSSSTTTQFSSSIESSQAGLPIISITELIYGDTYDIIQDDIVIGTFSITGGIGTFSSENQNTLLIEIDPDFALSEGDEITLFSVPEGTQIHWEEILFQNGNDRCLSEAFGGLETTSQRGELQYTVTLLEDEIMCHIAVGNKLGVSPSQLLSAAAFSSS